MAVWLVLLTILVVVLFLQVRKLRRELQHTSRDFDALAAYVRRNLVPDDAEGADQIAALDAPPDLIQIEAPAPEEAP